MDKRKPKDKRHYAKGTCLQSRNKSYSAQR